jgi:hypothetical protein
LDGNGVDLVFDEGKDSILEPSYEGAERIGRVWRAIQLFQQELINDFGLKSCMAEQRCKINISGTKRK